MFPLTGRGDGGNLGAINGVLMPMARGWRVDVLKNFLYLYGPNGAGKTRLLQTMEATVAQRCAIGGVIRIGAESLIDEMVSELPVERLGRFFAKYVEVENLMVDNCWVLARRPHAARMFLRLLRARQNRGKLTVVASDLPLAILDHRDEEFANLVNGAVIINLGRSLPTLSHTMPIRRSMERRTG
jgi:chromosomal replication initiation ATPase DnaA